MDIKLNMQPGYLDPAPVQNHRSGQRDAEQFGDTEELAELMRLMQAAQSSENPYALKELRQQIPDDRRDLHNIIAPTEHGEFGRDFSDMLSKQYGKGVGPVAAGVVGPAYTAAKAVDQNPAYTAGGRLMKYLAQQQAGGARSDASIEEIVKFLKGAWGIS